jgi:hypothetical protein
MGELNDEAWDYEMLIQKFGYRQTVEGIKDKDGHEILY